MTWGRREFIGLNDQRKPLLESTGTFSENLSSHLFPALAIAIDDHFAHWSQGRCSPLDCDFSACRRQSYFIAGNLPVYAEIHHWAAAHERVALF